jgi:hypothetical protein
MESLIAWILMAAVSLPISFLLARVCLRGVMRLMSGDVHEWLRSIDRPTS